MWRWRGLETGLAAAVMALALLWAMHGPGIQWTVDSATYLSAADNLASGDGLRTFTGAPLTAFPPGLPVAIATLHDVGLSLESAAVLINVVSVVVATIAASVLLQRHARNNVVRWLTMVVVATSWPIIAVSLLVWSESAFVAACLGSILAAQRLQRESTRLGPLVILGLLSGLAFSIRYTGVIFAVIGVVVLLGRTPRPSRSLAIRLGLFLVIALGPALAWWLRNHAADGTLMGRRVDSDRGIGDVLDRLVVTFGRWAWPVDGSETVPRTLGWIVLLALVIATLLVVSRRLSSRGGFVSSVEPLALFVIGHTVIMVGFQLVVLTDPINWRLMIPVYLPGVVLAGVALDRVAIRFGRRAFIGVGVALAVFAGAGAVDFVDQVSDSHARRASAELPEPIRAEVASSVGRGAAVFSNAPDVLWRETRRQPLHLMPYSGSDHFTEAPSTLDELRRFVADSPGEVLVVWSDFVAAVFPAMVVPQDLGSSFEVTPLLIADGWSVFRVTAGG